MFSSMFLPLLPVYTSIMLSVVDNSGTKLGIWDKAKKVHQFNLMYSFTSGVDALPIHTMVQLVDK